MEGEITQSPDRDVVYEIDGEYETRCGQDQLTLGFDTSIVVPKSSIIQFYINIPRNLKITHSNFFGVKDSEVTSLKDIDIEDFLEKFPTITVSIWDSEAEKPIMFGKEGD